MCRRFVKTFAGLFAFSICSLSACLTLSFSGDWRAVHPLVLEIVVYTVCLWEFGETILHIYDLVPKGTHSGGGAFDYKDLYSVTKD